MKPSALPEAQAVASKCAGWSCVITSDNATAEELRHQLCVKRPRRFLFSGHGNAPDPTARWNTLGFTKCGGALETVKASDLRALLCVAA